jgi:hypothetical protein
VQNLRSGLRDIAEAWRAPVAELQASLNERGEALAASNQRLAALEQRFGQLPPSLSESQVSAIVAREALLPGTRFDGDVSGTATTLRLKPASVGAVALLPNAVDSGKIVDGSVSLRDLDTPSVDQRYLPREGGSLNGAFTLAPGATLDIAGTLRILGGNPAEGRVLKSKADGSVYWAAPEAGGVSHRTIAGRDTVSLVGGHAANRAENVEGAVIAGGGTAAAPNRARGDYASLGGGVDNEADLLASVGGGMANRALGQASAIAGGYSNVVSEAFATVGGGADNQARGKFSTVPGGVGNRALGTYSFAAGHNAVAAHPGAFVWNDSRTESLRSLRADQILMQGAGGVELRTIGGERAGVVLAPGGSAWQYRLHAAERKDARPADGEAILRGLANVPVQVFTSGTETDGGRHVAPDARAFNQAFGLRDEPYLLHAGDVDGVTLAALQALMQRMDRQNERIQAQDNELAILRMELQRLTRMLNER